MDLRSGSSFTPVYIYTDMNVNYDPTVPLNYINPTLDDYRLINNFQARIIYDLLLPKTTRLNQIAPPTGEVDMNTRRIRNMGVPLEANDAVRLYDLN